MEIAYCNDIIVKNVEIRNSNRFGLQLVNSESITVEDSYIHDNRLANMVLGSGANYIVRNCRLFGSSKSMRIIGSFDSMILNSNITGQGTYGLELLSSFGTKIIGNTIEGWGTAIHTGSFINNPVSEQTTIMGNQILNSKYNGISLKNNCIVILNSIKNSGNSINIDSNNLVSGNLISGGSTGISVSGATNFITLNLVKECLLPAIQMLVGTTNNTVSLNLFQNNNQEGVQAADYGMNNIWCWNYWSDYESRYPNATRNFLLWDSPYEISDNANDPYPVAL